MERKAFQLLHDAESSWWYRGRALVVGKVLRRFAHDTYGNVLDLGAGWGGMLPVLSPYGDVTALEPDTAARSSCSARGYLEVLSISDSGELPDAAYTLVAFFDVLEHAQVDTTFLRDVRRSLVQGGAIILTVPAFSFLWSTHDVEHHHYRRYEKNQLIDLLTHEGFEVKYASYWNMLLFPFALMVRISGRSGSSSLAMPRWLNALFFSLVRVESSIIPSLSLPLGTGLIVYAQKST